MKKWIVTGCAIVILGAGVYFGYDIYFKKDKPVMAAPVQTARVTRGDLTVSVSGSGSVASASSEDVKADESGDLGPLRVKVGDVVKKGQVLVSYVPADVSDQVTQAQNNLKKSQLQLEQLKKKYIEAQDDDSRAETQYQIETLKLDMQSTEASLADLRDQASEHEDIVAPIAGKVTSVGVLPEGQHVQEGAAIATVVDYVNLESVIQVDELDVTKVKVGQQATVTLDALPDTQITGTVTEVADEGTATNGVSLFDVTVGFKAQDGVKVGMTTNADILIEQKKDVLMVPIEAVREAGGQKFVLVQQAGGTAGGANGTQGAVGGYGGARGAAGGNAGGTGATGGSGNAGGTGAAQGATGGSGSAGGTGAAQGATGGSGSAGGTGAAQGATGGSGNAGGAGRAQGAIGSGNAGGAGGSGYGGARRQGGYGGQAGGYAGAGGAQGYAGGFRRSGQGAGQAASGQAAAGVMRQITVGSANDTYIEVLTGLTEGERVILPTVVSSSGNQAQGFAGGGFGATATFGGGGFGGGGFAGGGGGFGGGATRQTGARSGQGGGRG